MVELGRFALFFSIPVVLYAAAMPIIGVITGKRQFIKSARYAIYANGVIVSVAAIGLITAFLTNRFDIAYVFEYSNIKLPLAYKFSALYAGQAGSLLFWAWMLSLYMVVCVYQNRNKNHDLMPYVMFITMTVLFYFIFIMTGAPALFTLSKSVKAIARVFSMALVITTGLILIGAAVARVLRWIKTDNFKKNFKNYLLIGLLIFTILFFITLALAAKQPARSYPFETFKDSNPSLQQQLEKAGYDSPPDGQGLNPLLQNYGMWFHPPTLYMGYVGFTIPFAFAIAALITRNLGTIWITSIRKWTIFAWFFLGVGVVFGAQWAYMELGWGGYWMWDPVENASFMPWLVGTAFMHSIMIQEKKNMLKVWNMLLIIFTFALSLFGTFLTRSGVLSSVHSFGASSLGEFFLGAIFLVLPLSIFLLATRLDALKSENELDSLLSREASFLINNLLLVGAAFTVFWGTVFPLISEAITGKKPTVGPPFYEQVMVPIALTLFLITAICPLIAWRRATRKNLAKNFAKPVSIAFGVSVFLASLIGIGITKQAGFFTGLIALVAILVVAKFNNKLAKISTSAAVVAVAVFFAIRFAIESNLPQAIRFIPIPWPVTVGLGMTIILAAALVGSIVVTVKDRESRFGAGLFIAAISGLVLLFGSLKVNHPWALGSFFLLTFIFITIVLEFYRGTRLRFSHDKERAGIVGFEPFDILRVIKAFGTLIWKNKRRYGGYIIHTGIVLMFIGITTSSTWSTTREATLREGETMKIKDYYLYYEKFDAYSTANKEIYAATMKVYKRLENNKWRPLGQLVAEKNYHPNPYKSEEENQPTTEIGLFWNLKEDLYVILSGYDFKSKVASFKVKVNPLIVWIWIGGFVVCFGTLIVMWPDALEKKRLAAKYGAIA